MTQNKKEGWELHFDELWNEHDGTHFYKDEFRDFTRSLLHEREEEIVKIVNKWGDSLDEVINKVIKRK